MERVLGKKQSIQNEDWLKAGKRIEELVSREELDEKVHSTVEEIRHLRSGRTSYFARGLTHIRTSFPGLAHRESHW